MTKDELKKILDEHKLWIDTNGNEGEKADLRSADLRSADLSYANLRYADLSGSDLSGSDLSDADLRSADLSGSDLSDADLSDANLSYANLRSANLSSANLRYADLSSSNLSSANLSDADLSGSDFDFSCGFSLSCKGSRFTASVKLAYQYLAHLCTIKPTEGEEEELQAIKDAILPFAKKSHRAKDLGLLDDDTTEKE